MKSEEYGTWTFPAFNLLLSTSLVRIPPAFDLLLVAASAAYSPLQSDMAVEDDKSLRRVKLWPFHLI
jgi:hypothetical protein